MPVENVYCLTPRSYPCVSLTGKMGSGKSTLSDFLVKEYHYTRLSFAQPLKDMVAKLSATRSATRTALWALFTYPISVIEAVKLWTLFGNVLLIPDEKPKARRRLQFLGNCVRDAIDPQFWVRLAVDNMRTQWTAFPDRYFVFDDARYPNEIDILKQYNFIDVRVECNDALRLTRLFNLYGIQSPADPRLFAESETAADNYKFSYLVSSEDGQAFVDLSQIIWKHNKSNPMRLISGEPLV